MTKQVMFYEEATPISKERHADMSVRTGTDFSFARNVNSVPVTAVEFPLAAAEYAIVFAGTEEAVMPAVVLGAMQDRNCFVDESGNWKAKFVPAFVRRYPFVFAGSDNGDRLTLCIDEAFAGCNREGRGERLFDADGERTQYLNGVLRFQQEFQAHFNATRAFCRKLKDLDLLEPVQARFTTPGATGTPWVESRPSIAESSRPWPMTSWRRLSEATNWSWPTCTCIHCAIWRAWREVSGNKPKPLRPPATKRPRTPTRPNRLIPNRQKRMQNRKKPQRLSDTSIP